MVRTTIQIEFDVGEVKEEIERRLTEFSEKLEKVYRELGWKWRNHFPTAGEIRSTVRRMLDELPTEGEVPPRYILYTGGVRVGWIASDAGIKPVLTFEWDPINELISLA